MNHYTDGRVWSEGEQAWVFDNAEASTSALNALLSKTQQNWVHRDDKLPPAGCRILVYSPCYENGDQTMLYRLMDSQFFKISKEAIWWCKLTRPTAG